MNWRGWRPHLFFPKSMWRLEITAWWLFGVMVVVVGWFEGW